jgi:hypothetical protein
VSIPQEIPAGAAVPDDEEANIFTHDVLTVKCGHHIDGEPREGHRFPFAVVPDPGSGGETVRFNLNYNSKRDAEITLLSTPESDSESWGILQKEEKAGESVWTLECAAPLTEENILSVTAPEYWAQQQEPNVYKLKGPEGKEYQIECYCPDQWKLEFSLPAMKSYEAGRKVGKEVELEDGKEGGRASSGQFVETKVREQSWDPLTTEASVVEEQSISSPTEVNSKSKTFEADTPAETISLSRNGEEVSVNILELVGSCLRLAKIIRGIFQKIQDDVPKIGWYYKWDLQFMQGVLDFRWGWKEYAKPGRQHEAFYWASLNASLALFGGSIEVGIGVETVGFVLQVFGRIQGGVRLAAQLQRTSPDSDAGVEMGVDGKVKGLLGARFEAGFVVSVDGSAELTTALVAKGDFQASTDGGMEANIDFYWTGLVARLTYSENVAGKFGKHQKKSGKTFELLKPEEEPGFKIGSWTWPGGPSYEPGGISRSEIRDIMSDTLRQGHKLLGGEYDVKVEGRKFQNVLNDIVGVIDGREDLLTDRKNIQAMALEIRHELADRMVRSSFELSPDLSQLDYWYFIRNKLGEILDRYEDPAKKMIQSARQSSEAKTLTE